MNLKELPQISDMFSIRDGMICKRSIDGSGRVYSRELTPEILEVLTTPRKVLVRGVMRWTCVLYQHEYDALCYYIHKTRPTYDPPKVKDGDLIVERVGNIDIYVNDKKIDRYEENHV